MLGSTYASARITMVGGVTEILYLSVAKLRLRIHEQDFAGDLVVLLHTRVPRSVNGIFGNIRGIRKASMVDGFARRLDDGSRPSFATFGSECRLINPPTHTRY